MTRGTRIALVAGLVAAGIGAALLVGVFRPDAARGQTADAEPASGITVTGTGSVKGAPDRADFSFGVETQGESSAQALGKNGEAVQKVIDALKQAGIADGDIQTQQVSVSPRYSSDGQKIVGYTAVNSVAAKVRDLAKAGAVVEAAVGAGANQVYGPTFSISDQSELYADAMMKALEDARAKAETIAKAAGVSLGAVTAIVEGSSFGPPVPVAEAQAGGASEVPIQPGQQEIVATLTVTYALA
jgi:uncharacterized protein YggE